MPELLRCSVSFLCAQNCAKDGAASFSNSPAVSPSPVHLINSKGFLAEVFHPWVRWEGPGSGFENSSGGGAGGGVWAQVGGPKLGPRGWAQAGPKWVGPSRAQVGGPKLGPRGWAQVGGPRIHRFGPLGIEVEKQGFRTVRLITGQKFP